MSNKTVSDSRKHATVAIVMGSTSDWDVMQHAARQLKDFGVPFEARALSAHRTPHLLADFVEQQVAGGTKCFIAGAGGAAHLAGVVAALTILPVLAVPIPSKHLGGLDSLLSMVQMPGGIPVGVLAVGKAGAVNAAILATQVLGLSHEGFDEAVRKQREAKAAEILANLDPSEA